MCVGAIHEEDLGLGKNMSIRVLSVTKNNHY